MAINRQEWVELTKIEQLVDTGKVHLSDPVEKYFPDVNKVQGRYPSAPPITLVELATHTSGLDREPHDTEKYVQGPVADWEKTLIAALPQLRYAYEPGTRFFTRILATRFLVLPWRVRQANRT